MDIRQLKHFVAVAETLHFGKAAERLRITQPPLSQSIIRLEQELRAPLFLRTKRRVALTPFGEQWLRYVKKALEGIEALPEIARHLRDGAAGQLHLSFVSTADFNILPTLVRRYRSLYPEVELSLNEATSDVQITAIANGRGHVGIIIPPANASLPIGLTYHKLVSEPLIAAVPESWFRNQRFSLVQGKLSPASIIEAPIIIFPRPLAPAFYDLVMNYYASWGGYPHIAQQAIQMQTIISLVAAGMGIALVPQSLRQMARTDVHYLDLEKPAPFLETGIIWRQDDQTATLRRFLEVTREVLIIEA
ncbi:MAG: LysR substrate-binding domain-containing protein [Zymomonas mobilis subsp. pomaceae]|uniref:Transcriptional regulator, LysR family n=1 Tax=Zymomonas mobilis subsp. pomaceae (strain ATCC 29192 / DSM 22645 / JCM 10191 / CCUG 17912 / NBRC 13757 / NCIMB 11200 / NRRL B-4491 / Barker I) TaxID=579138 RepID=F8ESZ4_ZYMMT|nr:LysR substrate-binding domain-containing protein [Zymomonas mobilis]AEI37898.1 transcriptional regulator, LysR family [Zymomonas mobilis subsp. pomaceae ATCC 29192]MDX5949264.1 LysR substrate-binding domain-containing protein [Zymomonas mobilis subsp. pomaceae]GEB89731.1 transcriptional regulator [Zymomonas mobilis subsp. pomaceae]